MRFTADAKFFADFTIEAESESEARATLERLLEGASANFGSYDNGDPILATVTLDGIDIEEDEA